VSSTPPTLVVAWDCRTLSDRPAFTIFADRGARLGYRSGRPYHQYSLQHTIEAVSHLRLMTSNDAHAAKLPESLRRWDPTNTRGLR